MAKKKRIKTPGCPEQIGDIVVLGLARPILSANLELPGKAKKPVIQLIYDYNREKTSVRVVYESGCMFTDEAVMPVNEGCNVWVAIKVTSNNTIVIRDYIVNGDGTATVVNILTVEINDISKIDMKYQNYVSYLKKKFF